MTGTPAKALIVAAVAALAVFPALAAPDTPIEALRDLMENRIPRALEKLKPPPPKKPVKKCKSSPRPFVRWPTPQAPPPKPPSARCSPRKKVERP